MTTDKKDGDVYFWGWKEEFLNDGKILPYHCKSQIAMASDGLLYDTYWGNNADCIAYQDQDQLDLEKVDIKFQGNANEMQEIRASETWFYRREDIVDMRHPNDSSAKIYLKPGAERDAATITLYVEAEIATCRADIKRATDRGERLLTDMIAITQGRLDDVH